MNVFHPDPDLTKPRRISITTTLPTQVPGRAVHQYQQAQTTQQIVSYLSIHATQQGRAVYQHQAERQQAAQQQQQAGRAVELQADCYLWHPSGPLQS